MYVLEARYRYLKASVCSDRRLERKGEGRSIEVDESYVVDLEIK